ncbi:efflux RND transporter periplasmic adaptor subunit [Aeoliella sp. SH292]|uniref:efflux RND transporter periplasmic adaptor subunit n=1 Tax=Aeoliella sp. SH292 TaxID=3454464 RepID=UPI003F97153C
MDVGWRCGLRALGVWPSAMLAVCVIAGCDEPPAARTEVVRPVKTLVVVPGSETQARIFSGTVEASRRVELAFQVSGLLASLPIKEGQRVAKGDLIAQLRTDEFQTRLDSLQSQLDQARVTLVALRAGERREEQLRRESLVRQAQSRLANARANLQRTEPLVARRAVSELEYDSVRTQYEVAQEEYEAAKQLLEKGTVGREEDILAQEASVRGLEAQVVEANIQLSDATLTAPYDGVIAQRFVEEGQNVRAKEPVVRFQDVEEIEIVIDVPEVVMAADLSSSDVVETLAELSSAPGVQFPVVIREMAQVADPTTQTFRVRAAMQVPDGVRALPGMTARVTMNFRRAKVLGERIMVPVAAVVSSADGEAAVWTIDNNSTTRRQVVKLGEPSGGQIEIVEGLEPGVRIAVAGANGLREGTKVRDLGDALGGVRL